jgi:hypothetical protein
MNGALQALNVGASKWTRGVAVASLAMAAILASGTTSEACAWRNESGEAAFPIDPGIGGRYLKDASGQPFFISGDSPWSLIADLTREDAELYLQDRRARGFNTLLVNLIEHRFTRNAPANTYGEEPFLLSDDFANPNPAYFEHARWVMERACELGFVVLLAPAYVGFDGGEDGWYVAMAANGPERLRSYGRFVGETFGHLDNIVWAQAGDFDPPKKELVRALVAGINEADTNAIHTVHGAPESPPLDYWNDEPWLAINNIYTYKDVYRAAREQYGRVPVQPFFLMESAYENEHGADANRVRLQAYQAVLSGATGHLFGNNPIWHFDGPGLHPHTVTCQAALGSPGARSVTKLHELMARFAWWRLAPDFDRALLVRGLGRSDTRVIAELVDRVKGDGPSHARAVAALANDGSFALIYIPSDRKFTIDAAALGAGPVIADWYDPTSGETTYVDGSPLQPARQRLSTPGKNADGDEDWVLILRDANAGPSGDSAFLR